MSLRTYLASGAVALAIASLFTAGALALRHRAATEPIGSPALPLLQPGEHILGAVVPLVLAAAALVLALFALRTRLGLVGLALSAIDFLFVWLLIGTSGFRYLF